MIESAADIRVFLADELPCYTLDDGDEFVFIVQASDVERIAIKLWNNLSFTRNKHVPNGVTGSAPLDDPRSSSCGGGGSSPPGTLS